ncbi:MAG TPA: TlpA disulfide reductase family protein [Chitinophagaceae bacterium]|jgi:peroxiredoxin
MSRIFFPAILFLFFVSCKPQAKNEFQISGTFKNAADKIIYLEETPLSSGQKITVDSSPVNNDGSFHLKGNSSEESLFSLSVPGEIYPFAYVINDQPKIIVNADANDQNDYQVKGSPASQSLKDFSISASNKSNELYRLGRQMDSLKKAGVADTSSSRTLINKKGEEQLKDIQDYVSSFIKNSDDPITSVWALGSYSQYFSTDDYQSLLDGIVKKFPDHKGIAAIKQMNDREAAVAKQKAEQYNSVEWVDKPAPELSLPDIDGREIKLSSFRGKFVLVDFWASWCLPCRRENPNVVKAYNKYKDKNFAILGVSLDKEKDDWLQAIQEDKLSWTHVSDLKEWNSIAVSTFGFNSIPFNILIDPQGKIIAQGLDGDRLDIKLSEVLH